MIHSRRTLRTGLSPFAASVSVIMLITMPIVADAQADDVAFDLHIQSGQVPANVRLIRVKQGDVVRLRWQSDRPMTLHLHGYDIERQVAPGTVTDMSFTARAAGRFSIEEHTSHGSDRSHGAPIVRIEVLPR